jgi:hypothetical protein
MSSLYLSLVLTCRVCSLEFPEDHFRRHKKWNSIDKICRACRTKRNRDWRQANPERMALYAARESERYWSEHPRVLRRRRNTWLKRVYGITIEDEEELLRKQDSGCGICGTKEPKGASGRGSGPGGFTTGRFCIDHDHETGKVRGILCSSCNFAIGYLKDNSALCLRAAKYLTENGGS